MIKRLFIDTETTGADEKRHALHQIAGIVDIDGKAVEEFDLAIKPFEGAEFDRMVLKNHGWTKEKLMAAPPEKEVYREFIEILSTYVDRYDRKDKFWLIGFVSFFDDKFLRALFDRMGDIYYGAWFFYPIIDICTIAGYKLMKVRPDMGDFKLGSVAKFVGLEVDEDKQHDALYDAHLARKLYYHIETAY